MLLMLEGSNVVEVLTVACSDNSKPVLEKDLTGDCRARISFRKHLVELSENDLIIAFMSC